eukprot:3862945-Rhodomonas_salina.2
MPPAGTIAHLMSVRGWFHSTQYAVPGRYHTTPCVRSGVVPQHAVSGHGVGEVGTGRGVCVGRLGRVTSWLVQRRRKRAATGSCSSRISPAVPHYARQYHARVR